MISFVIPFYNRWDLTHARLSELYKHVPRQGHEVVLIDDASTELDCRSGVGFWQSVPNNHRVRYTRNSDNLGFGGSMNRGIEKAAGDVIVLLSNDVQITKDVFSSLEVPEKTLFGGEYLYRPTGWNEFEVDGRKFFIPYANGWLLVATKQSWLELGGFDLRYGRFDFEDVDLSTQALHLGYNIYGLNSPNLRHLGGMTISTVTTDRVTATQKNRVRYFEKWRNKLLGIAEKCGTWLN